MSLVPISVMWINKIPTYLPTCYRSVTVQRFAPGLVPSKKSRQNSSTFLSVIVLLTYDQNNEKPRRDGPKHSPWSLVYVTFLSMSWISPSIHKLWTSADSPIWISLRTSACARVMLGKHNLVPRVRVALSSERVADQKDRGLWERG